MTTILMLLSRMLVAELEVKVMESNVYTYKDLTPAQPLDRATLNKMVIRSLFLQASFNYERMQAAGWLYGILPGLEKIHTNKEDLAASMTHNLEFFNTHPFLVTFVMGLVLSLEQQKADIATIRAVRVAAMGPLGGIGDAIFWFTVLPIAAGITSNMAIEGNVFAPVLFLLIFNGVQFAVRYWLMYMSYDLGTSAIEVLTRNAKEFTHAASMLGVFVVGALTCNYGATTIKIEVQDGEALRSVQAILDGILPQLVPLLLTLMVYYLIKKKGWSTVKCIGLLLILGLVGAFFGIWGGAYTPFIKWY
jgi:PTS system N-acetylgalactosamine-specific IID component